jgi:hypothetical protein
MIIVITTREINEKTKREELLVSHGMDSLTGKTVILPCDTPQEIGARFDDNLREFVIDDHPEQQGRASSFSANQKSNLTPQKKTTTPRPKW